MRTRTRRLGHFTLTLTLALLVSVGVGSRALAQTADDGVDQLEHELDAAGLLADQFVMMMSEALAGQRSPRPDQFQRAQILIDEALRLRDDDAELWRLRAELADRMDEPRVQREALGRYLRLRPDDDAVQLDLLLAGLRELQTLDDRLARLEAILRAGSAQRLSRPLRSRLATHAAIAAEELGDQQRFSHWLGEAIELDPANPQAAELIYALVRRNNGHGQGNGVAIGTALVNLVKAAPADPIARIRLARWLTEQAAYSLAERQFNTALILAGGPLPPETYTDWAVALAGYGDTTSARQLIDDVLPRREGEPEAGDRRRRGVPIDAEAYPHLRLGLEVLRLALLDDQPTAAAASFDRIRTMIDEALAGAEEEDQLDWLGDGQTHTTAAGGRLLLAWVAAVFNQQLDDVPGWLAEAEDDDPLVRRARGWVHVHRGEARAAAEQFQPIVDTDPLAALGVARLREAGSREQAEDLQRIVHRDAAGLAGLLASRMLMDQGRDLRRTSAGGSVAAYMERAPMHLWRPALTVSPWITMHLRAAPTRVNYLEPLYATVELRNTSRMPMPVAAGQGSPDRAMLAPTPSIGGEPLPRPAPTIVDLRRRLTLAPGETMSVTVRLDRSSLGPILTEDPTRSLSVNVLGVLGPRPGRGGGVVAEPVGGVDVVRALAIQGAPVTDERLDDWLGLLDSNNPVERMRTIARLLGIIDRLPEALDTRENRQRIADAINRRFPDMDPIRQAWTIRFLTGSERSRELFGRVFDAADRSDAPLVRLAYLATHLDGSPSPALNAAMRHDDATLRQFARALRDGAEARDAEPDPPAAQEQAPPAEEADVDVDAVEQEDASDAPEAMEPPQLPVEP
ncbi:MAG: hypothetical protein WD534_18430 [Phycisphaeraceae bacterium]